MAISGQSPNFAKSGRMSLDYKYPSLKYLKSAAKKRIPHFVWEYLDSGTGNEITQATNGNSLQSIKMMPTILKGEIFPKTSQIFLGKTYNLPFGVAPVGMSGLIWADAERHLAKNAAQANIPYTLSTVACQTPETIGPLVRGNGWFQLYPPKDPKIRKDMIKRIANAGFETLVLTLDLPAASRRERQNRGGITQPPVLSPRILAQIALRPKWAFETVLNGRPEMPFVASYTDNIRGLPTTEHIGYLLRTSPDLEYLLWLRDNWKGHLIVKGILNANDVPRLEKAGVDAIWVSNHAGRQFDAAPPSIKVLPIIRQATNLPIIFDSGVETALDILRATALGADFVMLGRAWHYALGALGPKGPAHLTHILKQDLLANMAQLGLESFDESAKKIWNLSC